jgi:hypothetical protein
MHNEHEIDALLSRDEAGSIIDRLMALPRSAAGKEASNEWDRAVAGRFEAHLAQKMRELIGVDNRRDAA